MGCFAHAYVFDALLSCVAARMLTHARRVLMQRIHGAAGHRCHPGGQRCLPLFILQSLWGRFGCKSALCSKSFVLHAATVGVITETNAEKAIEELKAYEVRAPARWMSVQDERRKLPRSGHGLRVDGARVGGCGDRAARGAAGGHPSRGAGARGHRGDCGFGNRPICACTS